MKIKKSVMVFVLFLLFLTLVFALENDSLEQKSENSSHNKSDIGSVVIGLPIDLPTNETVENSSTNETEESFNEEPINDTPILNETQIENEIELPIELPVNETETLPSEEPEINDTEPMNNTTIIVLPIEEVNETEEIQDNDQITEMPENETISIPVVEEPTIIKTTLSFLVKKLKSFVGDILNIEAVLKYENETPIPDKKINFYADEFLGSDITDDKGNPERISDYFEKGDEVILYGAYLGMCLYTAERVLMEKGVKVFFHPEGCI